jgi:glycosyltransferase involved in cell wall biosynthesis
VEVLLASPAFTRCRLAKEAVFPQALACNAGQTEEESMAEPQPVDVSIVVPMHNEEGNVQRLWEEVDRVIPQLKGSVELVLVNDGSTDRTGELLRELAGKDPRVRVVELDGNWGQASAFCAGFEAARGQVVMTMDGDLQNDPADFPKALAMLNEGFRVVTGWRKDRQERYWDRVLPSKCANWLIGAVTGVRLHDNGCGLKAYRADIVKGIYLPRGFNRFMPAIFGVRRDEVAEIVVNDRKRHAGQTHYGLKRLFVVMKDLLAIPAILSGAKRRLPVYQSIHVLSMVGIAAIIVWALLGHPGWWLLAVLPLLVLGGVAHLVTGNLKRFLEVQRTKGFKIREIIGGS